MGLDSNTNCIERIRFTGTIMKAKAAAEVKFSIKLLIKFLPSYLRPLVSQNFALIPVCLRYFIVYYAYFMSISSPVRFYSALFIFIKLPD